jgi:DNA-directed RNA polymerase specialized sigma24 family protein
MAEDHGWGAFLAADDRALERYCHRKFASWGAANVDDAIQEAWITVSRRLKRICPHYQVKQVGGKWYADGIDNLSGYFLTTVHHALAHAYHTSTRELPTDFEKEYVKESGGGVDEFLNAESLVILKEKLQRHPERLASASALANGDPYDHKNAVKVVLYRILTEIVNTPDGEIPEYTESETTFYDTVKTYLEEECPYYFAPPEGVVGQNALAVRRHRGKKEMEEILHEIFENYGDLQDMQD